MTTKAVQNGVAEMGAGTEVQSPAPTGRDRTLNIYQRLAVITGEITVHASGRNQEKGVALSIWDTETALNDLMAKHGVVTVWRNVSMSSYEQPTKNGSMTMWLLRLSCQFVNADDPDDQFVAEWEDIGNNPAAAASFVRKAVYKAVFHLAEERDDVVRGEAESSSSRPGVDRPYAEGDACPLCAAKGGRGRFKVAAGGRNAGQLQCTGKIGDEWQNHLAPAFGRSELAQDSTETMREVAQAAGKAVVGAEASVPMVTPDQVMEAYTNLPGPLRQEIVSHSATKPAQGQGIKAWAASLSHAERRVVYDALIEARERIVNDVDPSEIPF